MADHPATQFDLYFKSPPRPSLVNDAAPALNVAIGPLISTWLPV
jgi:hypothetical protein